MKRRKSSDVVNVPLLGTITAGRPIEAIEIPGQSVSIPREEIKTQGEYYALRVAGESMINEGIFDGDTVVIRKQATAEDGQTVVAIKVTP